MTRLHVAVAVALHADEGLLRRDGTGTSLSAVVVVVVVCLILLRCVYEFKYSFHFSSELAASESQHFFR